MYIRTAKISEAAGQPLIDEANRIVAVLTS